MSRLVHVITGDILKSDAQTLVNTVNCVGVMGKGIALAFRKRFPEMYDDYVARCERGEVKLGRPYLYRGYLQPWILNFPTKDHWRSVARLDAIVEGMRHILEQQSEWRMSSLACPPLGCGEGRLEWRIVGRILYSHLGRLGIPVELYAPHGTPVSELEPEFLEANTASARAYHPQLKAHEVALVEVLWRIQNEQHHWPIGRTTFQKLAYFATEFGLPTGYQFDRSSYGPFDKALKSTVTRLVNNGLVQETREGGRFALRARDYHAEAREEYGAELLAMETAIDRVADLALRLSPPELELAATAHYVWRRMCSDRRCTERDIFEAVLAWKRDRRPGIDETAAAAAVRVLNMLGHIRVGLSPDLPIPTDAVA